MEEEKLGIHEKYQASGLGPYDSVASCQECVNGLVLVARGGRSKRRSVCRRCGAVYLVRWQGKSFSLEPVEVPTELRDAFLKVMDEEGQR